MKSSKIFFSYSREDSEFALKLATDLRLLGSDIWIDQLDIRAGSRWDSEVETALLNANSLLVILTPHSVASNNVIDEISYALEQNKTIIPILLKNCTIPFRIRRLQYANFTISYNAGYEELLKATGLERLENNKSRKNSSLTLANDENESKKPDREYLEKKIKNNFEIEKESNNQKSKVHSIKNNPDRTLVVFSNVDYYFETAIKEEHSFWGGSLYINSSSLEFKISGKNFRIDNISNFKLITEEINTHVEVSYYEKDVLSKVNFYKIGFFSSTKGTTEIYNKLSELISSDEFILYSQK